MSNPVQYILESVKQYRFNDKISLTRKVFGIIQKKKLAAAQIPRQINDPRRSFLIVGKHWLQNYI